MKHLTSILSTTFFVALISTHVSAANCPGGMIAQGSTCVADHKAKTAAADSNFDVLGGIMDTSKKEINVKEAIDGNVKAALDSPEYKAWEQGSWEFFQANSNAKKGEYCTALFNKQGNIVALMGPGGSYKGALLAFSNLTDLVNGGGKFPIPEKPGTIELTLYQNDEPPAKVKAFHWDLGQENLVGDEKPMIVFAVPTIEAALDTMEEKINFRLEYNGEIIEQVEWHSGQMAKQKLLTCLKGK